MSEVLEREIAALPRMNLAALQRKWRSALKQPPPPHVRKQMLVPLLAYKLQEQAYGGLKPGIRRQLENLAKSYRQNPGKSAKPRSGSRIKPGTRLLRQWNGRTHQVTVVEQGYEYEGALHNSLSVIARQITGTRWSGPLFFGLRGQKS